MQDDNMWASAVTLERIEEETAEDIQFTESESDYSATESDQAFLVPDEEFIPPDGEDPDYEPLCSDEYSESEKSAVAPVS